jgi:NAD(P)-dependent dehydrogenase (short-subunit alcohol dehydrogenase family)
MKNIVIIGASTGIGRATAALLADQGHQVFGTYAHTQPEPCKGVSYHELDVLKDAFDTSWLPDRIDGLVYCPGSINLKPFGRIKPEDFEQDFKLQVVGAVRVIQDFMPALKHAGQVSIVLFSTVAMQAGFTFHAQVAASKGAIEGLTRALAAEFAPRIRVNCIAPSLTQTPLAAQLLSTAEKIEAHAQRHPLKRIGQPEDIAQSVAFLLSDHASWITGQVLHVDGGMSTLKV